MLQARLRRDFIRVWLWNAWLRIRPLLCRVAHRTVRAAFDTAFSAAFGTTTAACDTAFAAAVNAAFVAAYAAAVITAVIAACWASTSTTVAGHPEPGRRLLGGLRKC